MVAAVPTKPRLRGVSHQIGCLVALIGTVLLVAKAPAHAARSVAVYGASLVALLGISAAYHRPTWGPRGRVWMRRLDHAAIFLLVAGTYTPLCLGLPPEKGSMLRAIVWSGAVAGVLQSLLWVTAPKPLIAVIYVVLGWSILPFVGAMHAAVGLRPLVLLLGGGVVYSLGAVVYAKKRPDPVPTVFGYHEVFHALVLVAATMHYAAVALVVFA